jgi:hypothetical protein
MKMRNVFSFILLGLLLFFSFSFFQFKNNEKTELKESTALIQNSINQVSKLVVTEAQFSEVFNYKNSKELFGRFYTSEKKALVVVNAEVQIAYDLSKIEFDLDEESKTLSILYMPEPELEIFPAFEYYDVQDDYFNEFEASDYNTIKDRVNEKLARKIESSDLKENAKERLLTELAQFYILTNSLGWKLVYNENEIVNFEEFNFLD